LFLNLSFYFYIFVGCTLCIEFLMMLLSFNSQEPFEVAAIDFIAGIAATQRVLAHPLKGPC
jgi:hypothetical protein